jgi:hypothetical protein
LIYLVEGRCLEASLSAVSAIPLLGYLGQAGKLTLKAGQDAVDTVVGTVAKSFAGDVIEKAAKESLEQAAEKTVKNSGEWIYTALDVAGCVPGAGTFTTSLDGLIQLGKGRFLDATMSAISMVPVVGDVVMTGKKIVDSSLERIIKEAAEVLREKAAKEGGQELVEKSIKESGEELAEKVAKETVAESTEKVLKEAGEELAEKATIDALEGGAEKTLSKVQKELKEDAFIERITEEERSTDVKVVVEESGLENTVEDTSQKVDKTQFVISLKEKYGDEMVAKFLPFCERYGIDPYEVLTRPPAEGQTLIGWGLGINSPESPANHSLVELNLTKDELNTILKKSTTRPESKLLYLDMERAPQNLTISYQMKLEVVTYLCQMTFGHLLSRRKQIFSKH